MFEPDLHLQKPLEDYVEFFHHLTPRSLPLLDALCNPNFSFEDPYGCARSVSGAQNLLSQRFLLYPGSNYSVSDFMWGRRASKAYFFWTYRYKEQKRLPLTYKQPTEHLMEGMTELSFGPDGLVFSHTEFWSGHSHFNIKAYKKGLLNLK